MSELQDTSTTRSRREEVEDETVRFRQRLAVVGDVAGIGIWEYDFVNDTIWVSNELAALYGVDAETFTWSDFVSRLHPEDRHDSLMTPTPSYPFGHMNEFWFRVRHSDGHYLRIRSRSSTYGVNGRARWKIGAHIDMTDDSLVMLNEQLDEANERLSQFAFMASHDLRSPVRRMQQLLELVLSEDASHSPEETTRLLTMARKQAGSMDRLVTDMLDFAIADLDNLTPSIVDVERLLADTVASINPGSCIVTIDATLPERVEVMANPLAQCVRNLVDNACKYHDKPEGSVNVTATIEGGWLCIVIADDGPGIPAELSERIFDPFYTSDSSSNSGLGLAHVRRTVHKYHATMIVNTEPGRGTTFTIRWPVGEG